MPSGWVSDFVDALHQLEDQGDLDPLVSRFARDAGLWNRAQAAPLRGDDQIRGFSRAWGCRTDAGTLWMGADSTLYKRW